jgi:hypothetical protein
LTHIHIVESTLIHLMCLEEKGRLLSLLKREKLSRNFPSEGKRPRSHSEGGGRLQASLLPSVFFLLALLAMEAFVLSWLFQGSFVLPGFVSSGADLLLVL